MIGRSKKVRSEESSEIDAGGGAQKREVAPGFKRNMLIIGAVALTAVIVLVIILTRSGASKQPSASASNLEMGSGQAARTDNMSPEMKRKLEAKQREEAAAAAEKNKSYVPPDAPVVVQPVTGPGQSELAVGSVPVTRYARTSSSEADARRREGLTRQLAALIEPPPEGGVRQSIHAAAPVGAASGGVVAESRHAASAPGSSDPNRKVLIPGLEIVAAGLCSGPEIPAGSTGLASARIR